MKLDSLIEKATQSENQTVAVAVAEDEEVIDAVAMALEQNLADFCCLEIKKNPHTYA